MSGFAHPVALRAALSAAETVLPEFLPIPDSEVSATLYRLAGERKLRFALLSFAHPQWPRALRWLLSRYNAPLWRHRLRGIRSVVALQALIKPLVQQLLAQSADEVSASGFADLELDRPTLFIGSHHDICLDGVLLDLMLVRHGADTARMAIGDNLFHPPFVADLFCLNRGFSVQRHAANRAQVVRGMATLSAYIRHSLVRDGASVWIAQRNGRAKDGLNQTNPSLLRMLARAWRPLPFPEAIRQLRIVPLACSYEYDPCEAEKARACFLAAQEPGASKPRPDDSGTELAKGLVGDKGRIHVAAGTPIDGEYPDPEAAAAAIDRQMHQLFQLYPHHILAAKQLEGAAWPGDFRHVFDPDGAQAQDAKRSFDQRLAALPTAHRPYALRALANPVFSARAASCA